MAEANEPSTNGRAAGAAVVATKAKGKAASKPKKSITADTSKAAAVERAQNRRAAARELYETKFDEAVVALCPSVRTWLDQIRADLSALIEELARARVAVAQSSPLASLLHAVRLVRAQGALESAEQQLHAIRYPRGDVDTVNLQAAAEAAQAGLSDAQHASVLADRATVTAIEQMSVESHERRALRR